MKHYVGIHLDRIAFVIGPWIVVIGIVANILPITIFGAAIMAFALFASTFGIDRFYWGGKKRARVQK